MKKILILLIALAISITLPGTAGYAESAADQDYYNEPSEVAELMKLQERALDAYTVLRTIFTSYSDGSESYPDDYAGAWVDAPYLHIALTSEKPEVVDKYRELLKEYEDIIIYDTVNYSLNMLDKVRYDVCEKMKSEYFITCHYVDVITNRIVFEIEDLDKAAFNSSLSKISDCYEADILILKEGSPILPDFDLIGGARNNVGSSTS